MCLRCIRKSDVTDQTAQSDQGRRCPFTESLDTVIYFDVQRRFRSAYVISLSDLGLYCSGDTFFAGICML